MSYSWIVNWKSIFNDTKKETCKVRCRLVSTSSNTLTFANVGSVRASLQSNTSKITNGLNIGDILVKNNLIQTGYNYLECNTLDTDGFTMFIPKTDSSILNISIYDVNENLLSNCPYYQVWLYFDTDEY
jgi:hypothetical protein